ncbi:hypothetical protein EV121DRAFT_210670, partial [Schizophyllum commune]
TTRQTSPRVQSPIDRLPNELLCAIFLLTGDTSPVSGFPRDPDMHDDGIDPFAVRLYSKAAITIGRVCSRWMGVTRGFPALWALVDVAFPSAESTTILKRCLEYSAGLPLVLWISRSVDVGACDREIDPRFMRLVAANAHRWIEISIEMFNKHDALQPLIALPAGSFSALRRARLTFWGRGSTDRSADTLLWNVFHTSPQLVSLDWNHAEHIRSGLALAPLHQLTELGLHFAYPDTLVPILRSCTSLEVLLIGIHPTWHILGNEGPVSLQLSAHLPRLRFLTCRGPYDWAQLFSLLYVPALVRLDMGHMDVDAVDIEMMLRRSSARLMMLTIYRPAINQADNIIALLRSSILQGLQILRYERSPAGHSQRGWEDSFDFRLYAPSHIHYTSSYIEAEQYYTMLSTDIIRSPLEPAKMIEQLLRWRLAWRQKRCSAAASLRTPGQRPNEAGPTSRQPTRASQTPRLYQGAQGSPTAFTCAGCKLHAVEQPECAPLRPLVSVTTHLTYRHVQSPIDRLPNELLCAIFLLTGDPSPATVFPRDRIMHPYELDRRNVHLYSKCAVLLGRVCTRWRAVARSFPTLWTIVDVVFPGREATRRLQRCLRYSAGLPLTLWISRSLKFDVNKSVDSRFMSLVACNAHRWVEISIELWRELEVLQPLVALPPGSFQALRRARIYLYGAGTEASTADSLLWRSLCTSPNLEVVDWMREQYIETGLSEAPLHQLTRLAVHWINPSVLIPVLSTCTRLELLLISINSTLLSQEHQGPLPIHSPICLPHLRILMLCGPADWERLFSSLIAPTLDRLEISTIGRVYNMLYPVTIGGNITIHPVLTGR